MTREEAIKVLANFYVSTKNSKANHLCEAVYFAIQALKNEPKHGRWEHYKTEVLSDDIMGGEYRFKLFRCSECRFDVGGNRGFHYCPNCGAKMDLTE